MASLEFYQIFKEEKRQFYRLLEKLEEEEILLHLFYKASITYIPEPDKYALRKKKLQTIMSHEDIHKNSKNYFQQMKFSNRKTS